MITTLPARPRPALSLLLLILSSIAGAANLLQLFVWAQMLELLLGSSSAASAFILSTILAGLGVGSLLFHRMVSPRSHLLRTYGLAQFLLGLTAALTTLILPQAPASNISLLFILPATILMGASLPALARWLHAPSHGLSRISFFLAASILGAAIASPFAAFWLLKLFDLHSTAYLAAGLNVFIALVTISVSFSLDSTSQSSSFPIRSTAPQTASRILIHLATALSAATGLGAAILWTRLLSLLFGNTICSFAIILTVFLFGLALGSEAGSMIAHDADSSSLRPRTALGVSLILCSIAITWTAFAISQMLPEWPVDPAYSSSPFFNFQLDLARCSWALIPPTFLWGASFSLALAALAPPTDQTTAQDPAHPVGKLAASAALGAILGTLLFSLYILPHYHAQTSGRILIALAALSALIALMPVPGPSISASAVPLISASSVAGLRLFLTLLIGLITPILLIFFLHSGDYDRVPTKLMTWGRFVQATSSAAILLNEEGQNQFVAVSELPNGFNRTLHLDGAVHGSTTSESMRLQLMLGHYPALFHKKPQSVLVLGCGTGITAGSLLLHLGKQDRMVICEIEPLVPPAAAQYFNRENSGVVSRDTKDKLIDTRVTLVSDDPRHYLLTTPERFDIITIDPLDPWAHGAAGLATREFFEICRNHLNEGGLFAQDIRLINTSQQAVQSQFAAFFLAFPEATLWNAGDPSVSNDILTLGLRPGPDAPRLEIDADRLQKYLDEHILASGFLAKYAGLKSAQDILLTFVGRDTDLHSWLADPASPTTPNRDRNLRSQYLAAPDLYTNDAAEIYREILSHRRYPAPLFRTTPDLERLLRERFQ